MRSIASAKRKPLYQALRSTFISNVAIGIINLLLQIYLARTLGVEIVAEYAKVAAFVQIIALFTTYSFNHALIGVGYTVKGFENTLSLNVIQLIIMLAAWAGVGVYSAHVYPVEFIQFTSASAFIIIGLIASSFGHTINTPLEYELDYTRLARIRVISFACSAAAAVLLSIVNKSIYALIIKDFINGVIFLVVSVMVSKEQIRFRMDKNIMIEIALFAKSLWFVRGTSDGANRITFALLTACLDKHELGLYFQIRALADGCLVFLLNPIQSVMFSYFRSHRDSIDFKHISLYLLSAISAAALSGGIFFYLCGDWLVGLLLGTEWKPGSMILVPLVVYASIILYFEVLVSIAQAKNAIRPIVSARVSWIVAVIVLVPFLSIRYKLLGAAWATALCAGLMLFVGMKFLFPKLGRVSAG